LVRSKRLQRVEPFLRSALAVEDLLLHFRRLADTLLHRRVLDDDEMPGLLVGAARRCARRQQAVLDDRPRDRSSRILTYRTPAAHFFVEGAGPRFHLFDRILAILLKRPELLVVHHQPPFGYNWNVRPASGRCPTPRRSFLSLFSQIRYNTGLTHRPNLAMGFLLTFARLPPAAYP